ncbi:hypothetical protein BDP27DRAFT_611872 [Rhodocollybia butyracea]|uniref:Uncharacterized protein n=1 Tax=Rhodocollybia butyracea TaxID=206335 RepID=A0A9P5PWA3_9AGAR|nr:hypothetical protein BDP27DRAFT_611872 [Rhodocollybia butyracea]
MQAHAVEVQALRDAQEALTKELTRTFESRESDLLREKAEIQARLDEVSDANTTLSAESARLSLEVDSSSHEVQETQARITQVDQDYADMVHRVHSLQTTEANSAEDVSCLTIALDDALAEADRLRQELDELNASASQERSDLLDANNTLRSELDDATQELEMERTRSQSAAARFADETLILAESRDSARADFEQVCRDRDELVNTLYLELERERAESSRLSEEIRSLHQDRDDASANEKEETQRISSAMESKEQELSVVQAQLATAQSDFELSCTLLTQDISNLEMERDALQVTVTMLEEEARDAQRQKESDLQALRDEHDALLLRQTEEVKAEMQTTINDLQASLIAQIDDSRQLRASERSKEREIGSLRREKGELQRDLEATRTGRNQMSSDNRDSQARPSESQVERDGPNPDILGEPVLARLSDLRRQLNDAKETILSKSTQIEVLRGESRAALRRKTRETETLKTEMLAQVKDLQAQKGELSRRVSEMTTTLESKEEKIKSLCEQRDNLQVERDSLKQELESIRGRTETSKSRPSALPIGSHRLGGSESAGHAMPEQPPLPRQPPMPRLPPMPRQPPMPRPPPIPRQPPMPQLHPTARPLSQVQLVNPFFTLEATSGTSGASWRASSSNAGGLS